MARLPVKGPVVIPNCVMVKITWRTGTRNWSNIMHGTYTQTGTIPVGLAETVFSAIKAATSTTTWLTQLGTDTSLTGVHIKDLRTANQPEILSTSVGTPGSGATPAIGLNTSLVTTLRTAQAGRAFRGRTYLGGVCQSCLTNPYTFNDTTGSDAVEFINGIRTALQGSAIGLAIGQKALQAGTDHAGNPLPARPAAAIPVTAVDIANPRVDSQRRRTGR